MSLNSRTLVDRQRRLPAGAYRILGSLIEADDAVQEAWRRLQQTDANQIDGSDAGQMCHRAHRMTVAVGRKVGGAD